MISKLQTGVPSGFVAPAIQDLRALRATIEEEMKLKPGGGQLAAQAFVAIDEASMTLVLQEDDLEDACDRTAFARPMEANDDECTWLQEVCC